MQQATFLYTHIRQAPKWSQKITSESCQLRAPKICKKMPEQRQGVLFRLPVIPNSKSKELFYVEAVFQEAKFGSLTLTPFGNYSADGVCACPVKSDTHNIN